MTNGNVMSFRSLIDEMKAVAQGQKMPVVRQDKNVYASNAAKHFAQNLMGKNALAESKASSPLNIDSLVGVTRLINSENQTLLKLIAEGGVTSVADLATKSHRAGANVSRTLKKLVEIGVLKLVPGAGRAKVPQLAVRSFQVNVDVVTGEVQFISAEEPTLLTEPSKSSDAGQHSFA